MFKSKIYFKKNPIGTEIILHIDEVRVPNRFKKSSPKQWKYDLYKSNIQNMKRLDIPVTIHCVYTKEHPYGVWYIADGYIRYLVTKEMGIKYIPCKIVE